MYSYIVIHIRASVFSSSVVPKKLTVLVWKLITLAVLEPH